MLTAAVSCVLTLALLAVTGQLKRPLSVKTLADLRTIGEHGEDARNDLVKHLRKHGMPELKELAKASNLSETQFLYTLIFGSTQPGPPGLTLQAAVR